MRKTIKWSLWSFAVVFSIATIFASATSSTTLTIITSSLTSLSLVSLLAFNRVSTTTQIVVERRQQSIVTTLDTDKDTDIETEYFANTTSHKDPESGLFDSQFFPVFIEQRITAARRTLRPVSLVTFEIDGLDPSKMKSEKERIFFIQSLGDVITNTLRESDCAFRISQNTFAAVMDDTSEAGAVWAAERVRGVLHTGVLAGRVTVCAGVACYPSHALDASELIQTSNEALSNAKARGYDQVEIASIP